MADPSLAVVVLLALLQTAPVSLLTNGNALRGGDGWSAYDPAPKPVKIEFVDGVPCFTVRRAGEIHQVVDFDPATATWLVRATSHFDIYYTHARDLDSVAREAERAYDRVSRDQRRQVPGRVPLILLPTSRDLPRTPQEAAVIVRASGAADRDHLLLPVEPRKDREKLLAHELMHIFEFEGRPRRP